MPASACDLFRMDSEIYRTVLDNLDVGVCLVNRERKIVFWNRGAEQITGYQRLDVVGHLSSQNFLAQCNATSCVLCGASCPISEAMLSGKNQRIQTQLRHKAGHRLPVHLRVSPIRDGHGSIVCVAKTFVEDHEDSDLDLHRTNLATHGCLDLLTGVPNHVFTQSHLRENLFFFHEHSLPFGVLRIRIENLDELQASHGREAVDVILHVVAQTMKHTLRPDGFLGRWTQDEFLAIVTYCESRDLKKAAENVQRMVGCSGVQWWDDLLSVTVSILQTMVQTGDTLETLLGRVQDSIPASLPGMSKAASAADLKG